MEILYYGCRDGEKGHYLWERPWSSAGCNIDDLPNLLRYALDGVFLPPNGAEGQWQCSLVGPWTIVSWADFSVDTRGGSHSTFIGRGFGLEPHRLLEEARKKFPSVFKRQRAELKEHEKPRV